MHLTTCHWMLLKLSREIMYFWEKLSDFHRVSNVYDFYRENKFLQQINIAANWLHIRQQTFYTK